MNRILPAIACVGLAVGCANSNTSAPKAEMEPSTTLQSGRMPDELKNLFANNPNTQVDIQELAQQPYSEYSVQSVGNVTLHFATLGAGQTEQTRLPADTYISMFSYYLSEASKYPNIDFIAHPDPAVTTGPVNPQASIVPNVTAKAHVEPRNKNTYIVSVSEGLTIGKTSGGVDLPGVTTTDKNPTGTLIKTTKNGKLDPLNATVEACQGAVNVTISNPENFIAVPKGNADNIVQEQYCNSLGYAFISSHVGMPYSVYASGMVSNPPAIIGTSFQPGYFGEVPYVDEQLYSAIKTSSPTDPNGHFLYPRYK